MAIRMSITQQWDIEDYPIKEYHFHVYFFQSSPSSVTKAESLRNKILSLSPSNSISTPPSSSPSTSSSLSSPSSSHLVAVPLHRVNYAPIGPHLIGSYEVWVPIESFAEIFGFFTLNRNDLSVLVHPLTRHEVRDHNERAVWMGEKVPLDLSKLKEEREDIPLQYPELGLGYSKK